MQSSLLQAVPADCSSETGHMGHVYVGDNSETYILQLCTRKYRNKLLTLLTECSSSVVCKSGLRLLHLADQFK